MNIWQEYKNRISNEMQIDLQLFADIANKEDLNIYLVGGAVRDIIIGRTVADADIMVDGDATVFVKVIIKYTGGKLLIHDSFFTAVLFLPSGRKYDFTSCRKEYYLYPGALPITSPGSIQDDLYRRDFTINAMAMKLSGNNHGDVIDYFNGLDDIQNKVIRILHDSSFISDPTRIFRAVRFESKLGFTINNHTIELAKDAISKRIVDKVSGERIFNEIKQICNNKFTEQVIKRIKSINLLPSINDNWHTPILVNINKIEKLISENNVISPQLLRLTWLISSVNSKKDINEISNRLKISRFIKKHLISSDEIYNCLAKVNEDNSLGGIDVAFKSLSSDTILFLSLMLDNDKREVINDYLLIISNFKPLINGDNLIIEGIHPGNEMHCIINKLRYAQLNGLINDYSQAIELIHLLKSGT